MVQSRWDFNTRTLKRSYGEGKAVVPTTHLDNRPLLVNEEEDSDDLNDLIEELEFEEEGGVYECEMYYSEGWESENENEVTCEVHIEDNPAVYLTEIDPSGPATPGVWAHLSVDEKLVVEELLEANKDAFTENIAEEGQTLELGCMNLTDEQEFLYKEIRAMEEKGVVRKCGTTRVTKKENSGRIRRGHRNYTKISLELHEVVNMIKEVKEEEREDVQMCMMNKTYEPMSPISEETTPTVSDDERGPDEGNGQ
ncbi:2326_t:CDS:2 [Gigaspora rosea]|nr:2326_t:CDS:2 [Gigaspora rosea]